MIDIDNAKKEFDNYASQFNPEQGRIKLKIDHIKRVAIMCKKIAEYLKLDEEHVRLAEIIGLFHDIGRFKQAEIYNTFSDKDSVNHAEFSVKVLYEDNLIENFKIDKKYDNIIKLAILNHNKKEIDKEVTGEELLYSKIIRDADKLDIYYTICNYDYDFESIFWYSDFDLPKISDIIMNQFINLHEIDYKDVRNNADQILTFYAYIYNFYFDFSLNYVKEKQYLETFTNRVCENFSSKEIHSQIHEVLNIANSYLQPIR